MIEEALVGFLRNTKLVEPKKISSDKYKVKFDMKTTSQEGIEQEVKMCMQILKVNDSTLCVEFMRLDGDKQRFNEHYQEFKNQVLKDMNDAIYVETNAPLNSAILA